MSNVSFGRIVHELTTSYDCVIRMECVRCGSPLRVELVDEMGACVAEGLPSGVQLEVRGSLKLFDACLLAQAQNTTTFNVHAQPGCPVAKSLPLCDAAL